MHLLTRRLPSLAAALALLASAANADDDLIAKANALTFAPGSNVHYLGLFTHVEARADLKSKLESLNQVIATNPHIAGFTLKIQWRQLHPDRNRWDWEGFEALIAAAHHAGKLVNIGRRVARLDLRGGRDESRSGGIRSDQCARAVAVG